MLVECLVTLVILKYCSQNQRKWLDSLFFIILASLLNTLLLTSLRCFEYLILFDALIVLTNYTCRGSLRSTVCPLCFLFPDSSV